MTHSRPQHPTPKATAVRSRQAAAWVIAAATVLPCGPIVSPAHAASEATGAASRPAIRPAEAVAQMLLLEDQGRAKPAEASAAIDALLPSLPAFSAERLELLTVQGLMWAIAYHADAAERCAQRLDAWGSAPRTALTDLAAASAGLVRARSTARSGNLQSADTLVLAAWEKLPASATPRMRYRFVAARTYIKNESGQIEAAARFGHEALALADQEPEAWRRAEARTVLAGIYNGAKQTDRALALNNEALAIARQAQDWTSLARASNAWAVMLDSQQNLPGQRREFEASVSYARRAGAKLDEVRALGNLSDFFLKNGDYATALASAERALPLAHELNDISTETIALANLGLAHIGLQHLDIGKRLMREAIAIDEKRGSVAGVADSLRELGVYLEKAGDLPAAVEAYHQYRRLAVGLLQSDQQKAILAMQEQYDADGRTRALALLNRENEIKAEQLRQRDLQQRLWVLMAVASLLSLAVIALLYRRVRQTNEQLTTSNEMLKVQSERDPLTGLANRRHFQAVMRQVAADGMLSGTVFLIDIDHFKTINDRHGHSAGDAVLVEVARRLRETLREEDLLVRWGGEEFLVVVQSLAADSVDMLAQRMLGVLENEAVQSGSAAGGLGIGVTASIGFATFPIGPAPLRVSWERAINLVDTAMYLAKAHGRNRAYGVRLNQARDAAAVDAITRSLETAWRDGEVTLTLLQGRASLAAAA